MKSEVKFLFNIHCFIFFYTSVFFYPAQQLVDNSGNAFQNELLPGNQS